MAAKSTYKSKSEHLINEIIRVRRGFELNQGPDSLTITEKDGTETKISHRLRLYVVDEDDRKYWKLRKMKGGKLLHCLPYKCPRAYKFLYKEGLDYSSNNNGTVNRQKILKHLSDMFDCQVSSMIRNIDWKAKTLLETPGVFELMAYLDGGTLMGTTEGVPSREELDGKLYEETFRPLIDQLGTKVEELGNEVDNLATDVGSLTTDVENLAFDFDNLVTDVDKVASNQAELQSQVENLTENVASNQAELQNQAVSVRRVEKCLTDLTNAPKSILRAPTHKKVRFKTGRFCHVPNRAESQNTFCHVPNRAESQNTNMSHCVKVYSAEGTPFYIGILPSFARGSRIGVILEPCQSASKVFALGARRELRLLNAKLTKSSVLYPSIVLCDWQFDRRRNKLSAGVVLKLGDLRNNLPISSGALRDCLFWDNVSLMSYDVGGNIAQVDALPKQVHLFSSFTEIGNLVSGNVKGIRHGTLVKVTPRSENNSAKEILALVLGPSASDDE